MKFLLEQKRPLVIGLSGRNWIPKKPDPPQSSPGPASGLERITDRASKGALAPPLWGKAGFGSFRRSNRLGRL
ncbi:MAG: hypothetical protein CMN75_11635 [Spirochaeta sp.]|nr:hypothetical protein [Spirochaeta sp.]